MIEDSWSRLSAYDRGMYLESIRAELIEHEKERETNPRQDWACRLMEAVIERLELK